MIDNLFFYDLETTGFNHTKNATHEFAYVIDKKKKVVESKSWNIRPFEGAEIKEEALLVGGVTVEEVMSYSEESSIFPFIKANIGGHCKKEKLSLVGWNSDNFDNRFLKALFERNETNVLDYFHDETTDVFKIAKDYFKRQDLNLINYKLETVAKYFQIDYDPAKLHKGFGDVEIVRAVYYKLIEG